MVTTRFAKPRRKSVRTHTVAFSRDDVLASICRDSYFDFLKTFWSTIISEEPRWNWHIPYLCGRVQKVMERVFRGEPSPHDLIINICPGSTKSTIFSIALLPWVWTRMPSFRIINSSHGYDLSLDLSRKSRDIIESDLYRRLFPNIQLRSDQNTKGYYANTLGGMRYSTSTGGAVVGMHAHAIIIDDPLNPKDAAATTETAMDEANRYQREVLSTRKVDKRITPMIWVMQRLAVNDPTGDRLSRAKKAPVRHICLPADCREFPIVHPPRLKKYYRRGLMDLHVDRKALDKERDNLGPYGYAGQYGQQPVPRSGGMFDPSQLVLVAAPPRLKRIIRYWDKAGTKEGQGAYTAGVMIGDAGEGVVPRFYILHVSRFRENSAKREERMKQQAIVDGLDVEIWIEQEPGSGGKESAENTVRNLAGFRVRTDRPTGDKLTRADPFSVQVNRGNVAMVIGEWNQGYMDEMQFYGPTGKYKDQIDASAGAFNELAHPRIVIGSINGRNKKR